MANNIPRTPATHKPSTASQVKSAYRKSGGKTSLKEFVKNTTNEELKMAGEAWLFNKNANFSNPPLRIGNTGRAKKANKNKAPEAGN